MDLLIAIPKNIQLTEDEFIELWNGDPYCVNTAIARKTESDSQNYSIVLPEVFTTILGPLALNITAAVVYDLIKHLLKKKGLGTEIGYKEIKDGNNKVIEIIDKADDRNV